MILGFYSLIVGGVGVLVNAIELIDCNVKGERVRRFWLFVFFLTLAVMGAATVYQGL